MPLASWWELQAAFPDPEKRSKQLEKQQVVNHQTDNAKAPSDAKDATKVLPSDKDIRGTLAVYAASTAFLEKPVSVAHDQPRMEPLPRLWILICLTRRTHPLDLPPENKNNSLFTVSVIMAIRCSSLLLGIVCLLSVQLEKSVVDADTAPNIQSILTVSGWTVHGSREFRVFPISRTWNTAEDICRQHGAFLASVHDKNEDDFIKNLIRSQTGKDRTAWLGGQKIDKLWVWTDLSAFKFSAWAKGQPNGSGRCLQTNYKGGWEDRDCYENKPFVCARQIKKG
ncbi:hypothetical protein MHYP_G00264130 [Metynnis hypsauchen]